MPVPFTALPLSQDPAEFHPVSRGALPRHRSTVAAALLLCASLDLAAAQQAELISRPPNPNYFGAIGALPSGSTGCSMTADGKRIAFTTEAFNLFENDLNRVGDVVVHDRVTGSLQPVSLTSDGVQADGLALRPRMDGSGRYVLFETGAPNLGGSGSSRVYRHDRQNGQTVLASLDIDGVPFTSSSVSWDLSLDGNLALFAADSQLWLHDFMLSQTELVSIGFDGNPADQSATGGVLSDSDEILVFESSATNLVPGDTNGVRDLFIVDRVLGVIERLNGLGGAEPDGAADDPDVSADGRWITFASLAGNLVVGDTEGHSDVFLHDRQTATTIRLSQDDFGVGGNDFSQRPKISADGRFVVFESKADNLLPGLSGNETRLFLYDRINDQLDRVAALAGSPFEPCILSIGDTVVIAFRSRSHPLLPAGTNQAQMMLESSDSSARGAPATVVLSTREPALPVTVGNGFSEPPATSANGAYLAFRTSAENLVGRSGFRNQIVRLDLATGQLQPASQTLDGALDDAFIPGAPAISASGNRVVFVSRSSMIVPGITNNADDVFVRDLQLGQTRRVSVASDGTEADGDSREPRISANGNHVVFHTRASNLATGDTNNLDDIYVHEIDTGLTERISVSTLGAESSQHSQFADISADGRFVVFESRGSLLDKPTPISGTQIWLRDRQLGRTDLISALPDGTPGDGISRSAKISLNGRWVAFESTSTNLDPAFPGLSGGAVYLHDRQNDTLRLVSLDENQQPLTDSSISNVNLSGGGQALAFTRESDSGSSGGSSTGSSGQPARGSEEVEVYVVRLDLQQSVRIEPRTVDGQPPNAELEPAALSADGRMLYLVSDASNLVPGMINNFRDIYRIDLDRVFGDGFEG